MTPIRLLVVDDHAVRRESLCRALNDSADVDVVGRAAYGDDALRLVKERLPDILLLDLDMLRGNDLAMIRDLHVSCPQARLAVLLSDGGTAEDVRALMGLAVRAFFIRLGLASITAIGTTAMVAPIHTSAQSQDDLVWVADDITAQTLKTCTRSRLPCPPGSVQSFLIYTMPLAQAIVEQRPFMALTANYEIVDSFFSHAYPVPQTPAPLPLNVRPADCPQQTYYDNWSTSWYGGNFTVYASYWGNEYCGSSQEQYISNRETWNSGHGLWRAAESHGYSSSGAVAGDNGYNCVGLGATYNYAGSVFTKHPGADYLDLDLSSGSNCSVFDSFQLFKFYLY